MLHHALQQRQRKSSGFAGAGLGGAHHISALENDRNRLFLNRGHGFVAHFGYGAGQRFCQRKIGKRGCHLACYCRTLA